MRLSAPDEVMSFADHGWRAWTKYQSEHDVSRLRGSVAAIDPASGRVWLGEDALSAIDKMASEGIDTPVFLVRIGFDYLDVKGRR